jgi:hypothetical protein
VDLHHLLLAGLPAHLCENDLLHEILTALILGCWRRIDEAVH